MSYLVDTDWVADYLKGRDAAFRLFETLAPSGIAVSIVTYTEIYEGVYFGTNPTRHEAVFRQFLQGVRVIGINQAVARRAARVRGTLRRQGQSIGQHDTLIAATALQHRLVLVTRNVGHFERVEGLRLHRFDATERLT